MTQRERDWGRPMGTRQDTGTRGGLSSRFSDGVYERCRRGSHALLLGWLNGVMGL